MTPIDTNEIVFEIVKAVVLGVSGWLVKVYSDIKKLRTDLDCAFGKIRELERIGGSHDSSDPSNPEARKPG